MGRFIDWEMVRGRLGWDEKGSGILGCSVLGCRYLEYFLGTRYMTLPYL